MTTALAESLFLAVLALISWTAGFISGRGRTIVYSAAYKRGVAAGYRTGRTESERQRDAMEAELERVYADLERFMAADAEAAVLREQVAGLEETVAKQRRMLADRLRADTLTGYTLADHANNAGLPTMWHETDGRVCAVPFATVTGICGRPLADGPCPDHAQVTRLAEHTGRRT